MVGKRYLIEMKGVPTVCPEGFNEGFVACGYLERRRGFFVVGAERGNGGDNSTVSSVNFVASSSVNLDGNCRSRYRWKLCALYADFLGSSFVGV